MKIHEVLEKAKQGDWFRPTWYEGSGVAFAKKDGVLAVVPTTKGAQPATSMSIDALKSDWVFVSPDVVIAEREKWSR